MSACAAQCSDVIGKPLQILPVGPGDDLRRQARPVGGRPPAMHRDLIGGVAADHGDAGRILAGLVIGRPIDRAALHKAKAQAGAIEDDRRAGQRTVAAGPGMGNADFVEPGDRGGDRGLAVIDVVGDADGPDAGRFQRLAR